MKSSILTLLVVVGAHCAPTDNNNNRQCRYSCYLPDCRCWNDPHRPGNISLEYTPQIVSLVFSYALNEHTIQSYMPLFRNLQNPNNCSAKGTFFAQYKDTKVNVLRQIYNKGHEIGLTAADGKIPKNKTDWLESLRNSSILVSEAQIPVHEVKGVRSPEQYMGGNDEMDAMWQFGLKYDSSCVTQKYSTRYNLLWPYTYDIVDNVPVCGQGRTPNRAYPGIWQFVVPYMHFGKNMCSTLSGCSPYLKTVDDAFTFLYEVYLKHRASGRVPLVLFVDPLWMSKDHLRIGMRQFLEVIGRFDDTWLVTLTQALTWIRVPVPMRKDITFLPWDCPKEEKLANRILSKH